VDSPQKVKNPLLVRFVRIRAGGQQHAREVVAVQLHREHQRRAAQEIERVDVNRRLGEEREHRVRVQRDHRGVEAGLLGNEKGTRGPWIS
jgi:hypothetical protein